MKRYFPVICVLVFLASIFLVSASALAQDDFQKKIEQQQRRIDKGIKEGTLTSDEASKLQSKLDNVKDTYAKMKADGKVEPQEKQKLEKILDENSAIIYKKKHNTKVKEK